MAMTTCRECQRSVSDLAAACPGCGAPGAGAVARPAAAVALPGDPVAQRRMMAMVIVGAGALVLLVTLVLALTTVTVERGGVGIGGLRGATSCGSVISNDLNEFTGDGPCIDKIGGRQSLVLVLGVMGAAAAYAGIILWPQPSKTQSRSATAQAPTETGSVMARNPQMALVILAVFVLVGFAIYVASGG